MLPAKPPFLWAAKIIPTMIGRAFKDADNDESEEEIDSGAEGGQGSHRVRRHT